MRGNFPALVVLIGLGNAFSSSQALLATDSRPHTPLEKYINRLRRHQMNPVVASFTKICGVKLDEATHRFAFANDDAGTWKTVRNLPKAYDNLDMDLVGTVELWKNPAGTIVEEWEAALDVGGFSRTLDCFDKAGRLTALDNANFQLPESGNGWGMHERRIAKSDGTFISASPFRFVGLDEKPIPPPQLNADYKAFVAGCGKKPPSKLTIRELNLPSELFQ